MRFHSQFPIPKTSWRASCGCGLEVDDVGAYVFAIGQSDGDVVVGRRGHFAFIMETTPDLSSTKLAGVYMSAYKSG